MITQDFVTTIYHDRSTADEAVRKLHGLGYSDDDISIMVKDRATAQSHAKTGGRADSLNGLIMRLIDEDGLWETPLITGPLSTAFTSSTASAKRGGVATVLVLAGIPKERAIAYQDGLERGGILIGVTGGARLDRIRDIFTPGRTPPEGGRSYAGSIDADDDLFGTEASATRGSPVA